MVEYIEDVCDVLGIDIPEISFDISHFQTPTMQAQCSSDGKTIFLRKKEKIVPEQLFAVAHELRHIWQIRTKYDSFFSSYKTVDILGTEEYNKQPAEVDANAFASIIMKDFFGIAPLFHGTSEAVKSLISKREKEILLSL